MSKHSLILNLMKFKSNFKKKGLSHRGMTLNKEWGGDIEDKFWRNRKSSQAECNSSLWGRRNSRGRGCYRLGDLLERMAFMNNCKHFSVARAYSAMEIKLVWQAGGKSWNATYARWKGLNFLLKECEGYFLKEDWHDRIAFSERSLWQHCGK